MGIDLIPPHQFETVLVRMDRIGDLILTLPVGETEFLNDENCCWIVTQGLGFIPQHSNVTKNYLEIKKDFSFKNLFSLFKFFRKASPKRVVIFYAPWWIGFAAWLARVPQRVGRLSQWHSYLFFNDGLRQKRSRSEKHEMEFNKDLMEHAFKTSIQLKPIEFLKQNNGEVLNHFQLSSFNYYIIHPGMGGSALNWPTENYMALIKELSAKAKVIITGTPADSKYIDPLKKELGGTDNVSFLDGQLSTNQLISVLQSAKAAVAPSTGVVHISASSGTPTIGLYSPITAELAKRWSPKGPLVEVLEPNVSPQNHYPPEVMKKIELNDVLNAILKVEK